MNTRGAFLPPIRGVAGVCGRKTIVLLRKSGGVVETRPAREVRRRRSLPGGRAALGALLIALAAVGTFSAASGATDDRRQSYVVARADLAVGQRLARTDLATARLELPAFTRDRAFRADEVDDLVGRVVLGPMGRGELVQRSAVGAARPGRQVSFSIDPARAVGGRLQPGEFVDVVATLDGRTRVVVERAQVASVRDMGGMAGGDSLVVTLDIASAEAAVALVNALDKGDLTLVRAA